MPKWIYKLPIIVICWALFVGITEKMERPYLVIFTIVVAVVGEYLLRRYRKD
jgi:predicted ABC-type sugar transport system permease subunit